MNRRAFLSSLCASPVTLPVAVTGAMAAQAGEVVVGCDVQESGVLINYAEYIRYHEREIVRCFGVAPEKFIRQMRAGSAARRTLESRFNND